MQYLSVDHIIVYVYLAITLFIGFQAGRGIKNIREYALANKMYGTFTLTLTFLATNIAGISILGGSSGVFADGIIRIIPELGVVLTALFTAFFISKKIVHFTGCLTLGDVMGQIYGENSKLIAGILGLFYSIAIVSMELLGLGIVAESLLGIPASWGVIIGGIVLAIYSGHGGIKSVTITDVFQFLVLIIVFPFVMNIALKYAGGITHVFTTLPFKNFQVFSHEKFSYYLTLFLVWSILPVGITSPPIFQRLLMAKEPKQLRDQFLIVAGFHPTFQLLIMLIGLAGLVLYPNIVVGQDLVPRIIQDFLPVWGKGLAATGLVAVIMSTADSYLHAAGLLLAHDILKPISDKFKFKLNELRVAQYGTLLIGIAAIAIALKSTSMLSLSFAAVRFTGPLLMFPLIFGILGLRMDKQTFYIASGITTAAFIISIWLLPTTYNHLAVLISILVNGISLIAIHLLKNKGFVVVSNPQSASYIWHPRRKSILLSLKNSLPIPSNIIRYSRQKVAHYGGQYMLFGIFFAINYVLPFFMWTHESIQIYDLMSILRLIGALLCGLLIVKDKWPTSLSTYLPTFWHLTLCYCLPFMSTVMLLITNGSIEWLINIALSITLLIVLVDWMTFFILSLLGVGFGLLFYTQIVGPIRLEMNFSSGYLITYQVIFATLIGLIFARRKEQRFDRLATDNQILAAIEQETRKANYEIFLEKINLIKTLKNADIQKLATSVKELRTIRSQAKKSSLSVSAVDKELKAIESAVSSVALVLTKVEHRALDYMQLDVKPISIEHLLEQLQQQLLSYTLHYSIQTEQQQIVCDPIQLIKVMKNTIVVLSNSNNPNNGDFQQKDFYLTIQDTQLTYPLPKVDPQGNHVQNLSAIRIIISPQVDQPVDMSKHYTPDMSASALPNPTNEQAFLLAMNQRIIKAHYGYTNVDVSKKTTESYYFYVVLVDITEIRPSDMDAHDMELGVALVRADDNYPGAKEKEQAFLRDVQQKSSADIEQVERAIEIIKRYHGSVVRKSGEPYYLHPLAVAHIVLDWNQDEATIIGALLHDTLEDTPMLVENIDMLFGPEVVTIVDYVTHFVNFKNSFYMGKLTNFENKSMLLQATDKRALYVKVADRLHNMRTITGHPKEEKRKAIANETLEFFVPIALSLKLDSAAQELLDISNRVLRTGR